MKDMFYRNFLTSADMEFFQIPYKNERSLHMN